MSSYYDNKICLIQNLVVHLCVCVCSECTGSNRADKEWEVPKARREVPKARMGGA